MKKRIYTKWAKVLTVAILLAATVLTCVCGSWILMGAQGNMSVKEIIQPVVYENSQEATSYLQREGHQLLENYADREQYYGNSVKYDEEQTVDITDFSAGVLKEDKNEDVEYTLKSLYEFYGTNGYWLLKDLVDMAVNYVIEDDSDDEQAAETTEVLGPKAQPVEIFERSISIENSDYETMGLSDAEIQFQVKCYRNLYNVFYNNGIAIEKQYIQNVKGDTVAAYAQKNQSLVSIRALYEQLLAAAESVHESVDISDSDTNAMLYVYNMDTGAIYTNVDAWKSMKLEEIKATYLNNHAAADDHPALYYQFDEKGTESEETSENENSESMLYVGRSVRDIAENSIGEGSYRVFLALDNTYTLKESDSYTDVQYYEWYRSSSPLGALSEFYLFFVGAAIMLAMLILLCFQTGRIPEDKEIHPVRMDAFPIEIMMVGDMILWFLILYLASESSDLYYSEYSYSVIASQVVSNWHRITLGLTAAGTLGVSLFAWEIKRYGRRIKAKKLGGSIIKIVCQKMGSVIKTALNNRKENERLIIFYIVFAAMHFFFLTIGGASRVPEMLLIIWIALGAFDLYVLYRLLKNTAGRDELRKGMSEITGGNLDYQIDTEHMSGMNQEMADGLNRVRDGMKQAVEIEMKSERLKTDLITNVSHDIKTPLTSIINYVDILKRENIQDEKIAGYIEILDRKAQRLKQLTEDLVEASKISSGNITLEMQDINLKQLIKQTQGEFEEKFAERNLEVLCDLPESEMLIRADGRRIFRVIENLYNNAAKYAMPGSRVYLSGELKGGKVIFSVKNMSESPLNIKADELMERFVRGDVSRSTEGSGLGLEIARNLTLMQNGTFDLYLDGDLFKVTIAFDAI